MICDHCITVVILFDVVPWAFVVLLVLIFEHISALFVLILSCFWDIWLVLWLWEELFKEIFCVWAYFSTDSAWVHTIIDSCLFEKLSVCSLNYCWILKKYVSLYFGLLSSINEIRLIRRIIYPYLKNYLLNNYLLNNYLLNNYLLTYPALLRFIYHEEDKKYYGFICKWVVKNYWFCFINS